MGYAESDIEIQGMRYHLYTMGVGDPPLILAHGFTDHGLCWLRLAKSLASDRRVIMYDARGHGRSQTTTTGYSRQQLAEDLVALTEALGTERSVLMGHSMGADTVAWASALAPSRYQGVILEDPPWHPDLYARTAADRQERATRERAQAIANRDRGLSELKAWIRERKPAWHQIDHHTWAESKVLMDPRAAQIIASARVPWRELVPRIQCPVLLITGDNAQGALTTPNIAKEVGHLGRDVHHVRIRNAGHSIHRDHFDAILDAVRLFLVTIAPPDVGSTVDSGNHDDSSGL